MAVSPLLQITQLATSQSSKEVTINDGFIRVERSLNDVAAVDLTSGNVTLNINDYTTAFLFETSGHTVARDLTVPASKRLFAVRNSGTGVVTVKLAAGGLDADIPISSFCVLFNSGTNIYMISDSAASGQVSAFLSLPDTPDSFVGEAGRAVVVKATEDGLEFGTITVQFTDLTDGPSSYVGQGGKVVKVKDDATGIEFGTYYSTFIGLTDTPADYVSQAGKMLVVNPAETALIFQDVPEAVIRDTREFTLDNAGFEENTFAHWTVPSTSGSVWTIASSFAGVGPSEGTLLAYHDFDQGTEPIVLAYEEIDLTSVAYAEEIDQAAELLVEIAMASPNGDVGYITVEFYSESGALLATETSPTYTGTDTLIDRSFLATVPEFARSAIIYLNAEFGSDPEGDGVSTVFVFDDLRVSLKLEVSPISEFIDLFDTPLGYEGHAGKMVVVNAEENGVEFSTAPSLRDYFTQLLDTPSSYSGEGGKVLKVNSGATAIEFASFTFTGLTDTPATFAGQSGKWLKVNSGETALEFTDPPSAVGALDDLSDVDAAAPSDGNVLTYDSGAGEWIAAAPTGGGVGGSASEWDQTVAVSDEATDLTIGDSKIVFYVARTGTLTEVFTTLSGQSSSGDVTIDVRRNGTTIFATPPSINASEDTSLTGTVAVLSDTVWAKGDKIEIDIDAAGTGASGLKVVFLGTIPAIDSGEIAVFDRGSISTGTETPEPSDSAIQTATNDGAHTLAPPTETGYYVLTYTNGAAAGAITATGWDAVLDPDTVLSHTAVGSVVECAVLNDGVTSRLQVTLVVDAS